MAIRIPELIVVLSSLYETLTEEEGPDEIDARLCTELALNWLLNVYDGSRYQYKLNVYSLILHIYSLAFINNYKLRIDFLFLFKMT